MASFVRTPDGNLVNADHVAIVQALQGADGDKVNLHMAPFGAAKPQGPYRMTVGEFLAAAAGDPPLTPAPEELAEGEEDDERAEPDE